jgi:site-specific recombinase XerD
MRIFSNRKEAIFMDKVFKFNSCLAHQLTEFVNEYYIRGFKNRNTYSTLRMLDEYLCSISYNCNTLQRSIYDSWLNSQVNIKDSTKYSKAAVVIRFIKYLNEIGLETPIPKLPKHVCNDYNPYVFSHNEIKLIFEECDRMRDHNILYSSAIISFPTIIRLLYSTGMRVGEAISLKNKAVDLENHVIRIFHAKNNRQRLSPINSSLEAVLRQYLHYRSLLPIKDSEDPEHPFFVNLAGGKVTQNGIWSRFHRVLRTLNIKNHLQGGFPRVHDLRHTACVHAMKQLIDNGKDIYCCLGILSTFIGHVKIKDTEQYLRLTQEYYPELLKQDASVNKSINGIISRALIIHDNEKYY